MSAPVLTSRCLTFHELTGVTPRAEIGLRTSVEKLALKLPFERDVKEHTTLMNSKKKNFVIAGVVAAVLSLAAGSVAAQDYFFPLFGAYVDHVVPGDSPCGYTPIKSVTPSTYEETIMVWYLCEDNRVIARRFFRSGSGSQVPQPVYLVNPPNTGTAPTGSTPDPTTTPSSCPPGFVAAVSGGCVPPDHPLAAR
jgi:hypothetical protein